ncbi:MAG: class I SAM-dependent methyltransferase [Proteobacteria bacterium]|nr:class I SAM-dependent methyltransferase [Pseudomonadota bacterium]MBI3498483.1 class I SAM-dependent methyltransferase [Pseudomonadota bacterium]
MVKKALVNELYIEAEAEIIYLLDCIVRQQDVDITVASRIRDAPEILQRVAEGKAIGRTFFHIAKHIMRIDELGRDALINPLRGAVEVAHTMIGRARLDSLHACLDMIQSDAVPGDLIETGIWRGGATIFMRAWLMAHGITDRIVWAADSFDGVPPSTLPQDAAMDLSKRTHAFLAVSRAEVEELFRRYDLLDGQVRFLQGWFRDTLPSAPIESLAVLRLDGDLYESTMDALVALYDKVSPGGFVIVDDYYSNATCEAAVCDFRAARGINAGTTDIDADALYWRVP